MFNRLSCFLYLLREVRESHAVCEKILTCVNRLKLAVRNRQNGCDWLRTRFEFMGKYIFIFTSQ